MAIIKYKQLLESILLVLDNNTRNYTIVWKLFVSNNYSLSKKGLKTT